MNERTHPMDHVVLVNERDKALGTMEKLEAHRRGVLHRAFSVFIFNRAGRLLLQQRADGKYHSAGLWTNSCCSHPRPGELLHAAAQRRLREELGIQCAIGEEFSFIYKADVGNGLIEHELDHVFFGVHDGPLFPDPAEVKDVRWMRMNDLADDLRTAPERYTAWLNICWPRVMDRFAMRLRA
jgi:isopentenyl-diphosphate delta-isomerase